MTWRRAELALGAFALGLLNAASFSPWSHWAVSLLALTGLFCLMHLARSRGASTFMQAMLTFVFGMGWLGAGLSWLFISMHFYGGMPAPLAALADADEAPPALPGNMAKLEPPAPAEVVPPAPPPAALRAWHSEVAWEADE
jgi:hypothetical protein